MWLTYRRQWCFCSLGAFLVAIAGVAFCLVFTKPITPERLSRSFPAAGIKKIVLRAAEAETSQVTTDPTAEVVEVSGTPTGGAKGYHSTNPFWRETPAEEWGLDFVSARRGDFLLISTKNEIHYIHHGYFLKSLTIRVPTGVEVVREQRQLTGDGGPDLELPKP